MPSPTDINISWPKYIGSSVLVAIMSVAVTATWQARGYQEEMKMTRAVAEATAQRLTEATIDSAARLAEATMASTSAQRRTDDRVSVLERAFDKQSERMEWIMKSLERQERRSGYVPPPLPVPAD